MRSLWSMLSNWCLIGEIERLCSGGDVFILEETSGCERARRFVRFHMAHGSALRRSEC